jgi:mRNA-degrading endonuclease RelE of RelBE toxin-antitoxin system
MRAMNFSLRIQKAAASLRWSPYRCPRTKEDPSSRHLIFKKYRIIFEIDEAKRIVWINHLKYPYERFRPRRR